MTLCKSIISSILRPSMSGRLAGWIAFILLASACSSITPTEYSSFANIPESGIPTGWEYEFSPAPADSADIGSKRFDILLVVRFNNRCATNSVIFDIEELSLAHTVPDSTRLTIPLFNKEGRPLGNGNYGLFEVADTLRRGVPINEGYVVAVSSPLPEENTAGINAIGIVAVPTGSTPPLKGIWPKIK